MPTFKVYNLEGGFNLADAAAKPIEAADAEEAARSYAEGDGDGNADGIYFDGNHRDLLVAAEDGAITCVRVHAVVSPTYYTKVIDG
jgi:hypothetical protein